MSNFDIGTLLNYKPPRVLCEKCKALLYEVPYNWEEKIAWCPICNVRYVPSQEYSFFQGVGYLESNGNAITFKDPIAHGQQLASSCCETKGKSWTYNR